MTRKQTLARRDTMREGAVRDALERAMRYARGEEVPDFKRNTSRKGRTGNQRASDQYVAVQLSVQGYSVAEIARALGISEQMVNNDLAGVGPLFRQRAAEAVDEHRGRHLMMCDAAISDLWREWHRSKREASVTTTEVRRGTGRDGQGNAGRAVTKKETRTGDVNYIFGISKMMERTAKLAGLDKPVEAKVYVDRARDAIDRIGNALVEELHDSNPELLERLLTKLTDDSLENGANEQAAVEYAEAELSGD